jgi:hypothetical protein
VSDTDERIALGTLMVTADVRAHFAQGSGRSKMTGGHHYRVTFRIGDAGKRYGFTFHDSKNNAERGNRASAEDVLSCLLDDASTFVNCGAAEDLVDEWGLSAKDAATTWAKLEENTSNLRLLLGELFDTFLYGTDRD